MLNVSGLCVSYDNLSVLNSFHLELANGTIAILTGPNGSGKSSLLSTISGVIPEYIAAKVSGSITLESAEGITTDLRAIPLREKFRYLWHSLPDPDSHFLFPTCEAELAFALENLGLPGAQISQRIEAAAKRFYLSSELLQSPSTLSGGQKSLLLCAMAEALDPQLYLLDEPAKGLSSGSLQLLCQWLADLKQRGRIVLIAEHHPDIIALRDMVITLPLLGSGKVEE